MPSDNDPISRSAAKEAIEKCWSINHPTTTAALLDSRRALAALDSLPAAEADGRWETLRKWLPVVADDWERAGMPEKKFAVAYIVDKMDQIDAVIAAPSPPAAEGAERPDWLVEMALAHQTMKDWINGIAKLQDKKMDDPAPCDAEALAKAMHAAYEKHGCTENNINPRGAMECAKVVIQDWSNRLAPTLYRKEYRDGVVNGMKNAIGLIEALMATVVVVPKPDNDISNSGHAAQLRGEKP